MEAPLVSVIVPVYKVPEEYLKKCIESLILQTLKEIEIILIDDGSPDKCGMICDSYVEKDGRISVIHKKNGGVSSARNTGIDYCKGIYIAFVDGDDWIEENALQKAYNWISESESQLVGWNHYYSFKGKEWHREDIYPNPVIFEEEQLSDLYLDMISPEYDKRKRRITLGAIRGVWGKLYNTQIIKENNIRFSEKLVIGEDSCFNMDYISEIKKAVFYNEFLYYYRVFEQSANRRFRNDIVEIRLSLLRAYSERLNENVIEENECYLREVISCFVNILGKYCCHPQNRLKLSDNLKILDLALKSPEICKVNSWKVNWSFFSLTERILIVLIQKKSNILLYLSGKAMRLLHVVK